MQAHLSTPESNSRRRISSAISKLSLNKMRAFVSPSTVATHSDSPDSDQSEIASDSSLSVSDPPPCPILNANSQTMKNYASQRSNKTPFREPALFPTSLNFSQQTIYLFESNDTEDDENLNYYLNDLLLGPTDPSKNDQRHKDKIQEKPAKQNIKKFSLKAFPLTKSMSFQNPGKGLIQRSESTFFRAAKPIPLASITQPAPHPVAETEVRQKADDRPRKTLEPKSDYSQFSERARLRSLPTKLDTTQFKELVHREKLSTPLQVIPEQSIVSSPTLSTDSQTALLAPEITDNQAICPRIDMILTSSPFFNNNPPTLSPHPTQEPGTPNSSSGDTRGFLFQTLTPYTYAPPETPTTCVNSVSASHHLQATPHGKFAMSTGSPGIFSLPTPCSQPLRTPVRRQYSLLSPHYIPSPLPPRDSASHSQASRGPGADMLATLEFLSDLCQKSPEYMEEHDSLLERASLQDSNEP
ncbi:hypothetical protein PtA15_1A955 [Puccinia triticina]|uniref:Uncharacterized protein n=1 Tax=Puccinia triticina TaxID=208348 RepID=A0ABY7CB54_9BASI|nr:uncharacterized protein PtA15_1A955 [Puccinia triticina]WAQ81613.1 hypothetical protein PtA15_1A955 [Puccinia triticina]